MYLFIHVIHFCFVYIIGHLSLVGVWLGKRSKNRPHNDTCWKEIGWCLPFLLTTLHSMSENNCKIHMLTQLTNQQTYTFDNHNISTKRCEKKLQSLSHCGSFDHPDLHSLNNCIFKIFCSCNFKILEACNTPFERYFQDLSNDILKAPKFLKFELVNQKNKFVVV